MEPEPPARELSVSAVLAATLAAWPRLMFAFGPIYALQLLPDIVQGQVMGSDVSLDGLLAALLVNLLGLTIGVVCLGALTAITAEALEGRQTRLLPALDIGIRHFFPVLGAGGGAGLLVLVGMILLVVPGFILATWYFLVIPACVLERLWPGASLTRSAALSKGRRWRIFALILALIAAGLVAAAFDYAADRAIGGLGAAAIQVLAGTAVGIFAGILPVVTYRALAPERRTRRSGAWS